MSHLEQASALEPFMVTTYRETLWGRQGASRETYRSWWLDRWLKLLSVWFSGMVNHLPQELSELGKESRRFKAECLPDYNVVVIRCNVRAKNTT